MSYELTHLYTSFIIGINNIIRYLSVVNTKSFINSLILYWISEKFIPEFQGITIISTVSIMSECHTYIKFWVSVIIIYFF